VWDVHRIVGEKGRTRRTRQYRIMWHPDDATYTSWEPADNIGAPLKIQEWMQLTAMEQKELSERTDKQLYSAVTSSNTAAAVADEVTAMTTETTVTAEPMAHQ
jgi:hypothetical protein